MRKAKVGIILINYKDYANRFLLDFKKSLNQQDYGLENLQAYIIDNCASSESLKALHSIYPEAEIIPRANGNYSAACNLGCRRAILDGCKYVVTVNMDTELDSSWLTELVKGLEDNPDTGIVQSKVLLYQSDKTEKKINTLGNVIHFLGFGTTTSYQEDDYEINGYPEIRGYASGCSFIARREVFSDINGWNEEYFMYHDDIEFSLKAIFSGYKIRLAPRSCIYHKYEFSRSVKMLYFMERNRHLLISHFYPTKLLFLVLPALAIMNFAMMFYALFKGWFKTWLKVNFYFLNPLSIIKIIRTRRKLKKLGRLSNSDFSELLVAKLEFLEIDNFLLRYLGNPLLELYWRAVKKII
ncbi:MAG: glycosyltransferase family 2 protein [Patescibacteria group bacterium]|jgi:GT2 family glycosyltransferase|nr:glycosyltransferase family 2 protein [Patescibacteria group bacterium]MDD3778289.1 glycosyltransferase family 2 protein [Patescibacteria group bacterium]MDD3939278.1 glycosyltransferase family 2 protein [Patescibacteria group bacterium]MDD4443815.1 glycosyltransferase family 2 protein [Patescibacteria group bacterium]NCU39788.1 glycosyltransferase family 2 protein [Candidatus Falkowbacteria bacterium]